MQQSNHIVSAFDKDLRQLAARIAEMGGLAEEQLGQAIEALQNRDDALCEAVIASDKQVDAMEVEIEQSAVQIIALRQPMADDLRAVIAALKIASALERIGDLAKNIAKRARVLNQHPHQRVIGAIAGMGQQVRILMAEALNAYTTGDTDRAVAVWKRDIEIDELHNSIFHQLIAHMSEDNGQVELGSQLLFVVKNLERIGDHTTFVAEMTYFVVEGHPLNDERPKSDVSRGLISKDAPN